MPKCCVAHSSGPDVVSMTVCKHHPPPIQDSYVRILMFVTADSDQQKYLPRFQYACTHFDRCCAPIANEVAKCSEQGYDELTSLTHNQLMVTLGAPITRNH